MLIDSRPIPSEILEGGLPEDWLTLDEAAGYLKVSKPSIYRYCAEGKLGFYKLAGTGARRFKAADLDALLVRGEPGETAADTDGEGE